MTTVMIEGAANDLSARSGVGDCDGRRQLLTFLVRDAKFGECDDRGELLTMLVRDAECGDCDGRGELSC